MSGLEQRGGTVFSYARKVAENVVGIGAYREYREVERTTSSDPPGNRLGAVAHGIIQITVPAFGRSLGEFERSLIKEKYEPIFARMNTSVAFLIAADFGVVVFLMTLVSAGNTAEALALKAIHNGVANVVFDAIEHRARRPSSTPQT